MTDNLPSGHEQKRWFVVCCKPRQELVAQENLLRQGFRVYLPQIKVRKRSKGTWIDKIEALFPRYLFIQVDPEMQSISPVRSTRGVVGLVRFAGQPAIMANEVISVLIQREDSDSGLHQDDRLLFCAGEPVKLLEGSLAGMEGVFVQEDGEKRVIVLLELLGKTNKVKVNRDQVGKLK
jgi:transcriptional antiterminator RfaH